MCFYPLLLVSISLSYQSWSTDALRNSRTYDSQSILTACAESNEIKANREKELHIRKKILKEVLSTKDIYMRISIIESEYNAIISTNDIKDSVALYHDVNGESKCKRRRFSDENLTGESFLSVVRGVLSNIYHELYRYSYLKDDFFSLEMVNNISFLLEICSEYFEKCEYAIVEIVLEFLLCYNIKMLKLKDERTKYKIKAIVARIKKHAEALRKLILPISKSFLVVNNLISEMLCLDLPKAYKRILNDENISTIANAVGSVQGPYESPNIMIPVLKLFTLKFVKPVNMENLYGSLKTLKNNYKVDNYSNHERRYICFVYFITFLKTNYSQIELCILYSEYFGNISLLKHDTPQGLLSFMVCLLPASYLNFLYTGAFIDISSSVKSCYESFTKIADYKKDMLFAGMYKSIKTIYDLRPEDMLNGIKSIVYCYSAYIGFKCEESARTHEVLRHDMKALSDIIKVILHHLEYIDTIAFSNDINKYVKLCTSLEEFTDRIEKYEYNQNLISFSDYTHLLAFYLQYHRTSLHIDFIYNIDFLLGKSHNDTLLKLYTNDYDNEKVTQFYGFVDEYMEKLRSVRDKTSIKQDEIAHTLNYIIKCLLDIKYNDYRNILHLSLLKKNEYSCIFEQEAYQSQVDAQLNFIDTEFWPVMHLYTDVFVIFTDEMCKKYPIKDMYEAGYVSRIDIKRLYDACCAFICLSGEEEEFSLRLGVIHGRSKDIMNGVICDILFNSFRLIKIANEEVINKEKGLNSVQYLFRSLSPRYSVEIENGIIKEFYSPIDKLNEDNIRSIGMLGIYVFFEEIKIPYSNILGCFNKVKTILYNEERQNTRKRYIYKIIAIKIEALDLYIYRSIEKLDSVMLVNFGSQLLNTLEAIERSNNDLLIFAEFLEFMSKIIKITDDFRLNTPSMLGDICSNLTNYMIYCSKTIPIPIYIVSHCSSILYIIYYVIRLTTDISDDFVDICCSTLLDVSNDIKSSAILKTREIYRYTNIREMFLSKINELNSLQKFRIIISLTSFGIAEVLKYPTCPVAMNLLYMISGIFTNNEYDWHRHDRFLSEIYLTLKIFLCEIDENSENASQVFEKLFDKLVLLIHQDNNLLQIFGYKIVAGSMVDMCCYICYNAVNNPVTSLHCVCKTGVSDFNCLLYYDLGKYNSVSYNEFAHVCCICKR